MGIEGLSNKDVLSGIAKDRQGFVANVDMRKLLSYFPKKAADNLQEYCFR